MAANNQAPFEKATIKRISKLRVGLELDLAESLYSRFIKKGKSVKDKSSSGGLGASRTRGGMASGSGINSNVMYTGSSLANASSLAPILSTIQAAAGQKNPQLMVYYAGQAGCNFSPFFARLCPFH